MGRISRSSRSALHAASPSGRTLPAWLMSFGVHTVGFLTIALLFDSRPQPASIDRSERRAEIVLVPARARTAPGGARAKNESMPHDGRGALEVAGAALEMEAASFAEPSLALPPAAIAPTIPAMQLPQFSDIQPGGTNQVATIGSLDSGRRPVVLPAVHEAAILAEEAARPREALPQGIPAQLSIFGAAATGRSFVFVIDRSESMGSSRLGAIDAAAHELSTAINSLSAEQFFQVVAYNDSASVYARRELMPATDENKQELLAFVRKIVSSGGTEHTFGLQAALRLRPEVIYLFTDGGDPIPNALQLRTVRELAAGRTQIHCIQFGRGSQPASGTEVLKKLGAENSGQYVYIDLNRR